MSQDHTEDGILNPAESDARIEYDLSVLLRIVQRAHRKTELGIEEAIRSASEACFDEENINLQTRSRIRNWLLTKVAPGAPLTDLHGHFERVFQDETGIQLQFDQVSNETENQEYVPSEADSSHASNSVSPVRNKDDDDSSLADRLDGAILSSPSVTLDDEARGHLYIDNPPAHFQNAWQRSEAHDIRVLRRQGFELLGRELMPRLQRNRIAVMQYQADYLYERHLASKVISQWHNVVIEHLDSVNQADAHYENGLMKKSHTKVFDVARIQRIQAMDEIRLKGSSLYKMALAVRENHWQSHMDRKLKTRYLLRLINHCRTSRAHQNQLERTLQEQMIQSKTRALHPAVYKWVVKTDQIHQDESTADRYYEHPVKVSSINTWRQRLHDIEARKSTADDLHEYSLKNKVIRRIFEATQEKRNRKEVLSRWTLIRWRQFTTTSKHQKYDRAYKVARRNHKHRIARKAFHALQQEHQRLRALDQMASTHIHKKTAVQANTAIVKWYTKAMTTANQSTRASTHANHLSLKHTFTHLTTKATQITHMTNLADQYSLLQTKQTASNILRLLSLKTFDLQRKTQTALAFNTRYTTRQNRQSLRKYMDLLRVKAADKRGEGPLRLPPATPAQRRREDILRLSSTTPLYTPATLIMATRGGRRDGGFAARLLRGGDLGLTRRIAEDVEMEIERTEGMDGKDDGDEGEIDVDVDVGVGVNGDKG